MELKGVEYNYALKMVQLHSVHVHFPGTVMDILFAMKGTDERLLNPEYKKFLPMTQNVDQNKTHLVHVTGRGLKEAVGLAINIYTLADELRAIKEGKKPTPQN